MFLSPKAKHFLPNTPPLVSRTHAHAHAHAHAHQIAAARVYYPKPSHPPRTHHLSVSFVTHTHAHGGRIHQSKAGFPFASREKMGTPGYDYQRRYYQVRHKPLTVHKVEIKGNERTKAGLLAKVLEPVRFSSFVAGRTSLSRSPHKQKEERDECRIHPIPSHSPTKKINNLFGVLLIALSSSNPIRLRSGPRVPRACCLARWRREGTNGESVLTKTRDTSTLERSLLHT